MPILRRCPDEVANEFWSPSGSGNGKKTRRDDDPNRILVFSTDGAEAEELPSPVRTVPEGPWSGRLRSHPRTDES